MLNNIKSRDELRFLAGVLKKRPHLIQEELKMVLEIKVKASPELLIRNVVIANDKGEITCAAEIPESSESA